MTLYDMQEINVLDAMIANIHNELAGLYKRRAEILPSDESSSEPADFDTLNLSEIDLTLSENKTSFAI